MERSRSIYLSIFLVGYLSELTSQPTWLELHHLPPFIPPMGLRDILIGHSAIIEGFGGFKASRSNDLSSNFLSTRTPAIYDEDLSRAIKAKSSPTMLMRTLSIHPADHGGCCSVRQKATPRGIPMENEK